ncbi:MAG: ThuA domain-containing protein [Paludisphaera borealis]|uniref:ThuA domain-containing protein n=1 Tax=Paludisphaera borealis TaxID=1387353 RepID=UPI00284A972A|nr:ThuA domain-containing protein [Paludisphaera borealis]MDR3618815.1 ThuA domain-containing protein [Paludisphaera borealis]
MHVDRRSFVRTLMHSIPTIAVARALRADDRSSKGASRPIRVRIWSEGLAARSVYPDGIDGALAGPLGRTADVEVARASLDQPEAGLSNSALDATDVLIWWGRYRHDEVPDDRVEAVVERVRAGKLGLLALYTSCGSKPFRRLMNSMPCEPGSWREDGKPEFVTVRSPEHPITRGIGSFTIPQSDMFSEPFAVPEPESVVLVSNWERGETVRSGLTWSVDKGRVAYLRTGSESYPILFHPSIRQIVSNAVFWCAHRS